MGFDAVHAVYAVFFQNRTCKDNIDFFTEAENGLFDEDSSTFGFDNEDSNLDYEDYDPDSTMDRKFSKRPQARPG